MKLLATKCLIVVLFCGGLARADDDFESQVILLTDFSSSYYSDDRKQLLKKNFDTFAKLLTSEDSADAAPILAEAYPIGSQSAQSRAICSFTVARKGMLNRAEGCGSRTGPLCTSDKSAIRKFFAETCFKKVSKRAVENETDISGALYLASEIRLRSARPYLVIFSDMAEYRGDLPLGSINLEGFKVLIVCSSTRPGGAASRLCADRAPTFWAPKFVDMGVRPGDLYFVDERQRWAREARGFLR